MCLCISNSFHLEYIYRGSYNSHGKGEGERCQFTRIAAIIAACNSIVDKRLRTNHSLAVLSVVKRPYARFICQLGSSSKVLASTPQIIILHPVSERQRSLRVNLKKRWISPKTLRLPVKPHKTISEGHICINHKSRDSSRLFSIHGFSYVTSGIHPSPEPPWH